MKSNIGAAVLAIAATLSGTAYADSLTIEGSFTLQNGSTVHNVILGNRDGSVPGVQFTPNSDTFSIEILGKTCTFGSSTQGAVPLGCNYAIDVDGKSVTPRVREANAICLQVTPVCN